jgi:hypothetical protein
MRSSNPPAGHFAYSATTKYFLLRDHLGTLADACYGDSCSAAHGTAGKTMSDASNPSGASGGEIQTREQLVEYLWEAAEIEHQLLVQYLYAAFTMKRQPDSRCSPAQLEFVRRWSSTLLMVARQEMEHLALVNGMLSAIDVDPYFSRENLPRQSRYYLGAHLARRSPDSADPQPCDTPFLFERFNLATISRFVCAESPSYKVLVASHTPVPCWCFGTKEHPCHHHTIASYQDHVKSFAANEEAIPLARTHLSAAGPAGAAATESEIRPGTISELYGRIRRAFHRIPGLFTGNPQRQVSLPIEYQINIFPITDLASVDLAISLIVEEGEGIDAPPGFQSHFHRFFDIRTQLDRLLAEDPNFEPALPVMRNPSLKKIADNYTREVLDLFNESYVTLLFILTSLYRNFQAGQSSYPYLGTALQSAAFGPIMTMLLRPLAEVLAHLPIGHNDETAGSNYEITPAQEQMLIKYDAATLGNIDFFLDRLDTIIGRLQRLAKSAPSPDVTAKLAYVYQSVTALTNSLRRIYQIGELPNFVVSGS